MRAAIYARTSTELRAGGRRRRAIWRCGAAAALLMLATCTSPLSDQAWQVDAPERQRFAVDKDECMREAPQRTHPGTPGYGGKAPSTGPDEEYFAACMQARGWERK